MEEEENLPWTDGERRLLDRYLTEPPDASVA
jgi:hypothetical protein